MNSHGLESESSMIWFWNPNRLSLFEKGFFIWSNKIASSMYNLYYIWHNKGFISIKFNLCPYHLLLFCLNVSNFRHWKCFQSLIATKTSSLTFLVCSWDPRVNWTNQTQWHANVSLIENGITEHSRAKQTAKQFVSIKYKSG